MDSLPANKSNDGTNFIPPPGFLKNVRSKHIRPACGAVSAEIQKVSCQTPSK
jgi:hypothetical protein